MRLIPVLVQSGIYTFVVNVFLSLYGFFLTLSLQQLTEFMSLAFGLSLLFALVFRKLNSFARMFLSAALVSGILSYYFLFFYHVSIEYLQLFGVLFSGYIVAVVTTRAIIGDRYDDDTSEEA